MIIMNLFIGVIMNSMEESQREMEQRIHDKRVKDNTAEALFRNIEYKIDELKKEISSLKNKM
jgi:F0F1-type ATP synthase membrane subunit b/b'